MRLRILHLDKDTRRNLLEELLKRSPNHYGKYEQRGNEILEEVTLRRDAAVFEYTKRFDKAKIDATNIRVTSREIEEAYSLTDDCLIEVIRRAMHNIQSYHEKQRQTSWFDSKPDGTVLGQKVSPLQSVGVYVPGGKAAYPSTPAPCISGRWC